MTYAKKWVHGKDLKKGDRFKGEFRGVSIVIGWGKADNGTTVTVARSSEGDQEIVWPFQSVKIV